MVGEREATLRRVESIRMNNTLDEPALEDLLNLLNMVAKENRVHWTL